MKQITQIFSEGESPTLISSHFFSKCYVVKVFSVKRIEFLYEVSTSGKENMIPALNTKTFFPNISMQSLSKTELIKLLVNQLFFKEISRMK